MRKRRITFRRNVNGDDGDPTEEELADWVGVGEIAIPASKTVAQNSDKPLRPCCPVCDRSRRRKTSSREIEAAFASLGRERADALFDVGDGFFSSRRVQFACSRCATRFLRSIPLVNNPRPEGYISY